MWNRLLAYLLRRSVGSVNGKAAGCDDLRLQNRPQLETNPAKSFGEKLFAPSEPHAQIPFETDVRPWDEESALPHTNAVGQGYAGERRIVFDERHGTRLRFAPGD